MKWESNGLDHRLVADDGEVLERVRWKCGTSEYVVESTGKYYVGIEAAMKAAERNRVSLPPMSGLSGEGEGER